MTEPRQQRFIPDANSEAPGIPLLLKRFWKVFLIVFVIVAVGHGVLMTPAIALVSLTTPDLIPYMYYAFGGWAFLYTAATIGAIARIQMHSEDVGEVVKEFINQVDANTYKIVGGTVLYLNTVIILSTLIGASFAAQFSPEVGLIFAAVYGYFDLKIAFTGASPASGLVNLVFAAARPLGVNISIYSVLDALRPSDGQPVGQHTPKPT